MNQALRQLADALELETPGQAHLALAFAVACVQRVRHLIVDEQALDALDKAAGYVAGEVDASVLQAASQSAMRIAQSHPGSGMIDGSGSAAVSATTGLARALTGKPVDAAGYCAYAAVYAYSSSSVTDPRAYEREYAWQVELLRTLAGGALGPAIDWWPLTARRFLRCRAGPLSLRPESVA